MSGLGYTYAQPAHFRNRVWLPALGVVGLEGIHLHDLRHTGNQLTANAGANLKELMARMGHDSERAALIYLHSSGPRRCGAAVDRQCAVAGPAVRPGPRGGTRRRRLSP